MGDAAAVPGLRDGRALCRADPLGGSVCPGAAGPAGGPGHRTLTITRKGGKVVTVPLAPRTARAIDLAIGERAGGPVFLATDGRRLDRHGAGRVVRKAARCAGITKAVTPHTLRHAFITAALDAGVPLRDVQEAASHADPRTTMRYDRARGSLDRHATYIVAAYIAGAPGKPHQVAVAPPGNHGRQAELAHRLIPTAEADGRAAVTNRDPMVTAIRCSGAAGGLSQITGRGLQIRLFCAG